MKRYLFFLVLFLSITQVLKAQNPDPLYLKDAYRKGFIVANKDSSHYQRLFFDAFPSNYKTFYKYYGWNKKDNVGHPLTSIPPYYFKRFLNSKAYSRTALYKKVIGVAVNGKGGLEAVGMFQRDCLNSALAHNEEFISVLQKLSQAEIISVWAFYFDFENSYYRTNAYKKAVAVTSQHNKQMVPLITAGYKRSVQYWATHPSSSFR